MRDCHRPTRGKTDLSGRLEEGIVRHQEAIEPQATLTTGDFERVSARVQADLKKATFRVRITDWSPVPVRASRYTIPECPFATVHPDPEGILSRRRSDGPGPHRV